MESTAESSEELELNCSLLPEAASWAYRCGVFFDVENKSARGIAITGMKAGAYGRDLTAQLYACTVGPSGPSETDRSAWKQVWEGELKLRQSTPMCLDEPVIIQPGSMQGFLLASNTYAIYHTTRSDPVQDDNIIIHAGTRSTEHRGDGDPFSRSSQSRSEKSMHAGSVSYKMVDAQALTVHCADSSGEGAKTVTCIDLAGAERCTFSVEAADTSIGDIRTRASDELGLPPYCLRLLAVDGTVLSDVATIDSLASS